MTTSNTASILITVLSIYLVGVWITLFIEGRISTSFPTANFVDYAMAFLWPFILPIFLIVYAIDRSADLIIWMEWNDSFVGKAVRWCGRLIAKLWRWMTIPLHPYRLGREWEINKMKRKSMRKGMTTIEMLIAFAITIIALTYVMRCAHDDGHPSDEQTTSTYQQPSSDDFVPEVLVIADTDGMQHKVLSRRYGFGDCALVESLDGHDLVYAVVDGTPAWFHGKTTTWCKKCAEIERR